MNNPKTEQLSQIFKSVNKYIDNLLTTHKSQPSEVYKFVKNNMKVILKNLNLEINEENEKIVMDVVQHKKGMEKDKVYKFENFSSDGIVLESSDGILEYEKVLADYYETSIGHVEVIDEENKLFKIKTVGRNGDESLQDVVIHSNLDIDKMKSEIQNNLIIRVSSVFGVNLDEFEMEYPISRVGNIDLDSVLSEKKFLFIISKIIKSKLSKLSLTIYRNIPINFKGYFIWELSQNRIM